MLDITFMNMVLAGFLLVFVLINLFTGKKHWLLMVVNGVIGLIIAIGYGYMAVNTDNVSLRSFSWASCGFFILAALFYLWLAILQARDQSAKTASPEG